MKYLQKVIEYLENSELLHIGQEEYIKIVSSNFKNILKANPNIKTVLITGQDIDKRVIDTFKCITKSLSEEKNVALYDASIKTTDLKGVIEKNDIIFVFSPSIFKSHITNELISFVDGVILAEQKYKSLHSLIDEQLKKFDSLGKCILGIVLV